MHQFTVFVATLLLLSACAIHTTVSTKTSQSETSGYRHIPPLRGELDAPITIVAFMDLQSPYSSRAFVTLDQVQSEYAGRIKVQFRHFPQPTHKGARTAGVASMAAQEQGKFWEFVRLLLSNLSQLDRSSLDAYARTLGLDLVRFQSALDSGRYEVAIDQELKEASRLNVTAEPTFLVGSVRLIGAHPLESFRETIDGQLGSSSSDKKASMPSGPSSPY